MGSKSLPNGLKLTFKVMCGCGLSYWPSHMCKCGLNTPKFMETEATFAIFEPR